MRSRLAPLGRQRRVIEPSLAWLLACHRLGLRYERRANLLHGWLLLGDAILCLHVLASASG
jgi:hypothetical protein